MVHRKAQKRGPLDAASQKPIVASSILEAIREGLNDVKAGRTKPARKALKALAKKRGIDTTGH